MFKSKATFEQKIGDRTYVFMCDNDSPLGEAHDALAKFKSHVVELINKAEQASQESKKSPEGEPT